MIIQQQIHQRLLESLDVHHLILENESHMHNVPVGSESHFKLVMISNDFIGKRLVQRHQLIYASLQEEMQHIHALAMHLYTLDEWQDREQSAPLSPKCHGGE
ncbi:BolA family protein [Marinomonas posidonica]|uniref:BolA family protein n=1 Tax=Marinomonas posidonica (strain CECT 7376 / NCIMB 14433 / IVIA-Po-181) TaxID=491952 RepID=F6D0H1_MARPP|nr:BolA/IbaG family iron-sulfur metabolism protein [Marinomonas posidonica]AEF54769.1 BolA family protein [Marinomonas posidonica IVIA-Po-181]